MLFKEINPNLTILNSFMTCFKMTRMFLMHLVPDSFYICLNICLDQLRFLFTVHIYYFSHCLYLFYVASFKVMLFNCFPLFYIYICSDDVLNM